MNNEAMSIERLIRIETRLAKLQEHFGLPTRVTDDDVVQHAMAKPINTRLASIETRIVIMMEKLNLNPKTGKKNESR